MISRKTDRTAHRGKGPGFSVFQALKDLFLPARTVIGHLQLRFDSAHFLNDPRPMVQELKHLIIYRLDPLPKRLNLFRCRPSFIVPLFSLSCVQDIQLSPFTTGIME